jgi:hypothetical protein
MGKKTGKHADSSFITEYFGSVPEDSVEKVVERVKQLGSLKKKISDQDVLAIAEEIISKSEELQRAFDLEEIVVMTGNKVTPTASVQLRLPNEEKKIVAGVGVGPVDAALNAITKGLEVDLRLTNFKLEAISGGTDSLAFVQVALEDHNGNKAAGSAVSGDIVMASVEALVEGLNRLMLRTRKN